MSAGVGALIRPQSPTTKLFLATQGPAKHMVTSGAPSGLLVGGVQNVRANIINRDMTCGYITGWKSMRRRDRQQIEVLLGAFTRRGRGSTSTARVKRTARSDLRAMIYPYVRYTIIVSAGTS